LQASAFSVPQWSLGVSVSPNAGDGQSASFFTVANPFQNEHSVSIASPPASAFASYDFAWNESTGIFHAETNQTAPGDPNLFATSTANIRIQPLTDDLTVQIDAVYDYSLAGGDRTAEMLVGVTNITANEVVWSQFDLAQTIAGDPPSGIFEAHHTLSLPPSPPGTIFSLRYSFILRSFSGSPSAISTGTGSATFTITPEPSSAIGLLTLALLASQRCRRHR
jgi:hypothetical protein